MKTGQTTKEAGTKDNKKLEQRRSKMAAEAPMLEREAKRLQRKPVLNAEQRFKLEYSRMLRYNSQLIRRMNLQLQGSLSSRDIYALSTLMSQQREVINDLRAVADMSQQVWMLYERATNPFMSDVTQLVTDVYYQLRKLLMETTKPKETAFAMAQLDELVKQLGMGMQTSHGVLRQAIEEILIGGQQTVKTPRKKLRT